jgi:predicted PurR-regulated permease PerM
MKFRNLYSDTVLIAGIACLVLGIGNWLVGSVETAKYQNLLNKTARTGLEDSYRNFQELDQQKNEEVLRSINENREKFNAARAKLDFFYVVLTGGRILVLLGFLLVVAALIYLMRTEARISKQGVLHSG